MKLNVLRLERASLIAAAAISFLLPLAASAGEADTYLQSAHQLEKANDLRGAEIQLRNAAQSEPANGAIRLELARIYLRLGNPNSAQAELFAAHSRGADDSVAAPLMAQAMLEMCLRRTGRRTAKVWFAPTAGWPSLPCMTRTQPVRLLRMRNVLIRSPRFHW
jgi:thioredoxin-like negative regulator of GroEL